MMRLGSLSKSNPTIAARALLLLAFVSSAFVAGCGSLPRTPVADAITSPRAELQLTFVGQQVLPHGYPFADTMVGGLSGIDYDASTGRFWAISDDRSEFNPARFYEIALDISKFSKAANPGHDGITIVATQTLKRLDGTLFPDAREQPALSADPESIRVHAPSRRLIWSSEGERNVRAGQPPALAQPHVWEMERNGRMLRPFVIPDKFRITATNRGVRRNLGFEGTSFSPDYATLWVSAENALLQDGPIASTTESSPTRLIAFDYATGQAKAEYVIDVSPIPAVTPVANGAADNGISEILAIDDHRLLVVERAFVQGIGSFVKLFVIDIANATEVSKIDALPGHQYRPAAKRLLLDLATLGIRLDNLEGITWGPRLPNGHRSLVMVSDDNFNARQVQQFLLFDVRD